MMNLEEFRQLFLAFEKTACRIEARESYHSAEEAEPLRRFLAGEPDDFAWLGVWLERVRTLTARGKRLERVRVVSTPLSDYSRFGLNVSRATVEAGENIHYLHRDTMRDLGIPQKEFWIFDAETVASLHHGERGEFLGAELVTDSEAVAEYQEWWTAAWRHSQPRDVFLRSLA
ncbi:DUF6879 family protein [Streptosporangium sp. NPDC023825]|uniref:DUF6879 family protein n=1 Tax=Streptosporangium sp. NPDC023825 TaxID=3154909 RepID=UPI0034441C66